ncbi:pyridoxamine 5'-phosphate oxidase [Hoyosella subflava]|uniref:Pyridoxine/pyridoxamine 5'-phosphate oxidase n=1 Tax=Hoyosella subflava (strain DSM 45089 / JCM 17490 / NBRC 109087 / DQS3-9A1) TaxID=443218 RepID=F6EM99_HOYSD|nr:pyridoxamine 5'-phosphate oxidase [Hoyosella subflava]AEF39305.1 Pyridoxine/pyridoxamine 5'-phosphate oxidase [Hoyosella subflava DQS3-9A1]
MRVGYGKKPVPPRPSEHPHLDESWLADGWFSLFLNWLRDATEYVAPGGGRIAEPNAMVLGTVDDRGLPATRTVLCKGADDRGLVFYTNYESDKAHHLDMHPYASVTFPWVLIERQAHFRGQVEKVSEEETAEYWHTRPRGSQLGAWASHQSRRISARGDLEAALEAVTRQFCDLDYVPVPPFWGGYRLKPSVAEFWQGRENRLHNRIRCEKNGSGWEVFRLQP